jgi:hypothetical protein
MSVDGKIYKRLMEVCLLLHYLKPIVRKLYRRMCVALRGIIALLYAEPLVHLPLPSVPINTRLGTQYTFEGSVLLRPLRPSITHL